MKKKVLIGIFLPNLLHAGLEMNFMPKGENNNIHPMADEKSLGFGNAFILPGKVEFAPGKEANLSKEDMEDMQNAFFEMFEKIPEPELLDMCNQAVTMAEAEAQAKGKTLNEYLDEQFAQLNAVMPNAPSQLFAKAKFEKDSTNASVKDSVEKAPESNKQEPQSDIKVLEQSTNYGSDLAGNWLNKRSYAIESKTLISRAQKDLETIAEQKLKLLEQIKNVDDAVAKFYKESGTEIGKTIAKSPSKKSQSPSFAIEAFLNEQLQKIEDSKISDPKDEPGDSAKSDFGVIAYKIELVANECRKITDSIKTEIKKLQELEKTLSKRIEKIQAMAQDAADKFKSMSDKAKQIDHSYNDLTAQKLYSEIEQFQQHIALTKQFMESDEQSNISALKSALDSASESIRIQLKRMNGKVTSVLNPFKESL